MTDLIANLFPGRLCAWSEKMRENVGMTEADNSRICKGRVLLKRPAGTQWPCGKLAVTGLSPSHLLALGGLTVCLASTLSSLTRRSSPRPCGHRLPCWTLSQLLPLRTSYDSCPQNKSCLAIFLLIYLPCPPENKLEKQGLVCLTHRNIPGFSLFIYISIQCWQSHLFTPWSNLSHRIQTCISKYSSSHSAWMSNKHRTCVSKTELVYFQNLVLPHSIFPTQP